MKNLAVNDPDIYKGICFFYVATIFSNFCFINLLTPVYYHFPKTYCNNTESL